MTSKITMTYQCLLDMGVNWKRGGNQHRILHLLANSPEGEMVTAMRTKAGMGSGGDGYKNVRSTLAQLRALGLVLEVPSTDRYKITKKGADVSMEIGAPPSGLIAKPRTTKQKIAELYQRPVYDGAELGQTCMRPGAYDAYSLPSIMGGKPVAPTWRNL